MGRSTLTILLLLGISASGKSASLSVSDGSYLSLPQVINPRQAVFSITPPLLPATLTQRVVAYVTNAYHEVKNRQDELLTVIYCVDCQPNTPWNKLLTALSRIPSITWIGHPNEKVHKPVIQPAPLVSPAITEEATTSTPVSSTTDADVEEPSSQTVDYSYYYPSISNPYSSYPGFQQFYQFR